jgi:hypothetical protein
MSDQSIVRQALTTREEEAALDRLCSLLLDIEGSLLAYWTDIPEREIQRLQPLIREAIGDFERLPHEPSAAAN